LSSSWGTGADSSNSMTNPTTPHPRGRAWPSHLVVLGLAFGTTKGFALRP
jgi:hypothetical protein